MKKNDVILLISTLLFTFFLYQEGAGINYLLFSAGLCAFSVLSKPTMINNKLWIFAAALTIAAGVAIFYNANVLSLITWYMALSYLAGVTASHNATPGTAISYATFSYITSIGFIFSDMALRLSRRDSTKKLKINWSAVFTMSLFVIIVLLVFFFIYQRANPLFKEITKFINLDFLTLQWVLFTLWGFLMMYGFYYVKYIKKIDYYETLAPQYINKEKCEVRPNRFLWFIMDEKIELKSGIVLFLLLNIMIFTINVLDFSYLWSGVQLPEGFTFAGYLHQGIYTLIFSCLLAILLIMLVFRGRLNFLEGNKTLKALAYVWIIQNIFISFSCLYRNMIYISNYALTYKRITIFILLILVIIGLTTAIIKILKSKNIYYLYRINSFVIIGILVFASLFNWDRIITKYNLKNSQYPDIEYLASLNHAGLPMLLQYIEENEEYDFYYSKLDKNKIYDKAYHVLTLYEEASWKSFNLSVSGTIRSINKKYADGTLNKFVLNNKSWFDLSVLSRFDELRSLTLNNQTGVKEFDMSQLEIFSKLQELNLTSLRLESIEKLPDFKNLESVDFSNNNIGSFEKLSEYKSLKSIIIRSNPFDDISFLKALTNIEVLDISQTKVKNLQPISYLPDLKRLYLSGLQEPDFSLLPELQKLTEIDLSDNAQLHLFQNIPLVISNAPNLETVHLRNVSLQTLTFFSEPIIRIRRRINISGSDIDSKVLANLKLLNVEKNRLYNFAGIHVFGGLETLNAFDNNISEVAHLRDVKGIKEINLKNNPVKSLAGIEALESLNTLHLSGFEPLNIEPLTSITHLKILTLANGRITNPDMLSNLKGLEYLNIGNSNIASLDFLSELKNLEVLDISNYKGSDFYKILECPSLKVVIMPQTDRKTLRMIKEEIPQIKVIMDYDYNSVFDYYNTFFTNY